MTEKNAIELEKQLKLLGFEDAIPWVRDYRTVNDPRFTIENWRENGDDQLKYALHYRRDDQDYYLLQDYTLTLRNIPIPAEHAALENKMKQAEEIISLSLSHKLTKDEIGFCRKVEDELAQLHKYDKEAAELLMFKYWPYSGYIKDDSKLKEQYEKCLRMDVKGGLLITAAEAYKYLKEMQKEHVIADKLLAIAHKEISSGNEFIAFNTMTYYLGEPDMYFFKTYDEANEFAINSISDRDNYNVIRAGSIDELLRQIPYGEFLYQQLLTNKNMSTMIEKNFDYLKDNLRNHGFGETLNPQLEEQMKKGVAEFNLAFKTEFYKREMEVTLHFKKSDKTDMYFFNKYDASVKNEKDADMKQTFYINNGWGVTMKEAYNLLNGRAVHKELTNKEDERYKAWIQLDFSTKDKHGNYERKQYHENYGYDIKEALSYYPVKELLKDDSMKDLVKSLEKGNVQMVTFEKEGKDVRMFIEADPKHKEINVYDNRMVELTQDQRKGLMVEPVMREGVMEEVKQYAAKGKEKSGLKEDAEKGKVLSEKKNEKKSLLPKKEKGNGLMEKKRTATKKGFGIH